MLIKIQEIIGEYCSQRIDSPQKKGGQAIREMVLENWDKGDIEVSFEGVKLVTPSFLDEAFGKLVLEHNLKEMINKLKFTHIGEETKEKINRSVELRIKQKRDNFNPLDS
ncbi:MAG: STAS-like domain-containing protein [Candidatus Aureabacteria bacterium]|nr:STAS-like domain-containing protein [Candidatus Auribacterota bacterium]MCK5161466.1 STAS-like domain-containing protein [Candidatus Auribacterota bacterium]